METIYIIDKNGNPISPNTIVNFDVSKAQGYSGWREQVTLEFANALLTTNGEVDIDPSSIVLTGQTGNLTIQARGSLYSPFADIQASPIDISSVYNIEVLGVIQALKFSASNITGCNYIKIIYYRGG